MFIGHNGSVDTLCGVQIIVDFYFYAKCFFGKKETLLFDYYQKLQNVCILSVTLSFRPNMKYTFVLPEFVHSINIVLSD